MRGILEIAKNDDIVVVFDFDGVLGSYEYGQYNHAIPEMDWPDFVKTNHPYNDTSIIRSFESVKTFIHGKNKDDVYVCTVVASEEEAIGKREFAVREYGIKPENVQCVYSNHDKLVYLRSLHQLKYPNKQEHQIAMIEDNVEILGEIVKESHFMTIHISSFLK